MKHLVTTLAFSVTSLLGFPSAEASTPIDIIPAAQQVELHFRADASMQYLLDVRQALAERGVQIEYKRVIYDAEGKLSEIAFEVSHDGQVGAYAQTEVATDKGAYLFVSFADRDEE